MLLHPKLERQDASVHELLGASLAIFTHSECLLNVFIYSPRGGILLSPVTHSRGSWCIPASGFSCENVPHEGDNITSGYEHLKDQGPGTHCQTELPQSREVGFSQKAFMHTPCLQVTMSQP